MSHHFEKLKAGILALSVSKDWLQARREWSCRSVTYAEGDEMDRCLCEYYPIKELCILENRITGAEVVVGNVCVTQFFDFDFPVKSVIDGLKRIIKDEEKALNAAAIEFYRQKRLINPWEYDFLHSTRSKRVLTDKMMAVRVKINRKIVAASRRKRPREDLNIL